MIWFDSHWEFRVELKWTAPACGCIQVVHYTYIYICQSWAHSSLKSLNRSSLLSKPSFWEQWCSLIKRAKAQWANWQNQILSGPLMRDIRIKERRKNGWKRHKNARLIHILIKIPARLPPPPPSSSGACCVGLYSNPPPPPAWREFQVIHTAPAALIHAD